MRHKAYQQGPRHQAGQERGDFVANASFMQSGLGYAYTSGIHLRRIVKGRSCACTSSQTRMLLCGGRRRSRTRRLGCHAERKACRGFSITGPRTRRRFILLCSRKDAADRDGAPEALPRVLPRSACGLAIGHKRVHCTRAGNTSSCIGV